MPGGVWPRERFGKAEGHWQVNYFFCDPGYAGQRCARGARLRIGGEGGIRNGEALTDQ